MALCRRRVHVALALVLALMLSGCWDRIAVDELVIVLTLGIDVGTEPGRYAVTLETLNPGGATIAAGEAGELPPPIIITREGRTIMEAIQAIQRSVDRSIFLGQLQIVLFGEELARQGIAPTLDHLQRNGQLRRTMNVAVARGSAAEVMRSATNDSVILGLSLDALTIQAFRSGYIAAIFGDFLQYVEEPGASAVAPVFEISTSEERALTLTGTAAFQGDRLVGIFDTKESIGVALALRQAGPDLVLVSEREWEGERVLAAFLLRRVTSALRVRFEDAMPKATIDVRVEGVLAEQIGGGNFTTSRDWSILEQMQEAAVQGAIEAAIKRAQEWQTDVFRIGSYIEQRLPQQWRALEKNWPEVFAEMEIDVRVHSRLLETGLIKEPLTGRAVR